MEIQKSRQYAQKCPRDIYSNYNIVKAGCFSKRRREKKVEKKRKMRIKMQPPLFGMNGRG